MAGHSCAVTVNVLDVLHGARQSLGTFWLPAPKSGNLVLPPWAARRFGCIEVYWICPCQSQRFNDRDIRQSLRCTVKVQRNLVPCHPSKRIIFNRFVCKCFTWLSHARGGHAASSTG